MGLFPDSDSSPELAPEEALAASLPPDVHTLQMLTRLTALKLGAGAREPEEGEFTVPLPPLAGLSALTELELRSLVQLPPPTLLASLPRLAHIHGYYVSTSWREQLAALRPDISAAPSSTELVACRSSSAGGTGRMTGGSLPELVAQVPPFVACLHPCASLPCMH